MTRPRTLLTTVAIVLMVSAVHAASSRDPVVLCAPLLDKSKASFEACLKTYGASDEEAGIAATYLIQHQRALNRVKDKIGGRGRYLVYRPDGKVVDRVDPDALSAEEEKCVDDDFRPPTNALSTLDGALSKNPRTRKGEWFYFIDTGRGEGV